MLEINNLHVTFNKATPYEKTVLNSFNLTVNDGDFVVILGSNGAGKSTLFNSILGLVPYNGNIILDGKSLDAMPSFKRCKKIGVVYQDPLKGTAPNLSVLENMMLASKVKTFMKPHFKKNFIANVKNEIINYNLGLENQLNEQAKLLSGGQRQALTLYMATNSNPDLLLLDEHTAALDPNISSLIMEITNEVVLSKKITTLMITHNLEMALKYGNRLIILNQGGVVLDIKDEEKDKMTKEELMSRYSDHFSDATIFVE